MASSADALRTGTSVYNPASSQLGKSAVQAALSGLTQKTTPITTSTGAGGNPPPPNPKTTIGAGGRIVPYTPPSVGSITTAQNPISPQMRVGAEVASYNSQLQARDANRQIAMDAASLVNQASGDMLAGTQQDVAAGRQNVQGAATKAKTGVQDALAPAQAALSKLTQVAEQQQAQLTAKAEQQRSEYLSGIKSTAALEAQQLMVGSQASFEKQMANLNSLASQGLGATSPGTVAAAKQMLTNQYVQGVGNQIAQLGTAWQNQYAQYTLAANQLYQGIASGLSQQTVGAYATAAQGAVNLAQVQASVEQASESYQAAYESAALQSLGSARSLYAQGKQAQASIMLSPSYQVAAGDIGGLINSIWEMYQSEAFNQNMANSMSGAVGSIQTPTFTGGGQISSGYQGLGPMVGGGSGRGAAGPQSGGRGNAIVNNQIIDALGSPQQKVGQRSNDLSGW